MDSISPEECRRLEKLDEILREAANEYNRVAGPALMEKQAIIKGRRIYDVKG